MEKNTNAPIKPIPAVNGAIINKEGKILLTRRSPEIREPGKWCLPGGHLDGGEDWRTGHRREILEEVGLTVVKDELLGIYSDPSLTVTKQVLNGGFHGQFVVVVFRVTEYSGEVTPNFEVDKWDWFSPDNLPEPFVRSHPVRIKDAFEFNGQVFVR